MKIADKEIVGLALQATAHLGLEDAAAELGVSHTSVARWRNEEWKSLHPDTRSKLVNWLDERGLMPGKQVTPRHSVPSVEEVIEAFRAGAQAFNPEAPVDDEDFWAALYAWAARRYPPDFIIEIARHQQAQPYPDGFRGR